jgi:excisionase family DNA binding protein
MFIGAQVTEAEKGKLEAMAAAANMTVSAYIRYRIFDADKEAKVLPNLLTIDQTCIYLGCSRVTVNKMMANGDLPYTKIGREYRIYRDDVYNAVAAKKKCKI